MSQIERIEIAAGKAGFTVKPSTRTRRTSLQAPDDAWMYVDFDSAGRLTGATSRRGDMPAAGLEERVLAWISEHTPRVSASNPEPVDVFDYLGSQYEAEDAFAQGGRSGLDQLDEARAQRTVSPLGDVTNIASGNAVVDGLVGHVGVLAGRRAPRTPHPFEGISAGVADRPCTRPGCGLADRHPIHGGYTAGGGLTEHAVDGEPGSLITIDGPFGGDTFEIGLDGEHTVIYTRTDAEALRDRLVERFGPGPTDR